jgi:hypothetical protein
LKNNPVFYFLVTFSLGTLSYLLAGRRDNFVLSNKYLILEESKLEKSFGSFEK